MCQAGSKSAMDFIDYNVYIYTTPYYYNTKWRPFWKMAATALLDRISEGSISRFAQNMLLYMCAKFGAFRQN